MGPGSERSATGSPAPAPVEGASRAAAAAGSAELYCSLFERSSVPTVVVSPDGRQVAVNAAWCAFLGYTAEELLQLSVADVTHPDDRDETALAIRDLVTGAVDRLRMEKQYLRKDGRAVWGVVRAYAVDPPGGRLLVAQVEDVTERRRALEIAKEAYEERRRMEQALRDESAFRQLVIAKAGDGLCVCHEIPEYPYVAFTVWNDRMTEITGYTVDEINRLGWYQTMYPRPEVRERAIERMASMRQGDDLAHEEWTITRADGVERTVSISTSVVQSGDGEAHVLAVVHDITERDCARRRLEKANLRLRALTNCSQAAARAASEQELVECVCRVVCQDAGYAMAHVSYACRDESRSVRIAAACGLDDEYLDGVRLSWGSDAYGQGPTGTAIREGRTAVSQDAAADARLAPWRDKAMRHGYRSILALPLVAPGDTQPFGALSIYAREPNAFVDDEVLFLEEMASDLACGISALRDRTRRAQAETALQQQLGNIGLLNEITRAMAHHHDLESIYRVALQYLEDHLDIDIAAVVKPEGAGESVVPFVSGPKSAERAARLGFRDMDTARARQPKLDLSPSGEPLLIPDLARLKGPGPHRLLAEAGLRTGMVVPLKAEGRVLGALAVARQGIASLTPQEREFLIQLADHVALAAYQAELHQELRSAYDRLAGGQGECVKREA